MAIHHINHPLIKHAVGILRKSSTNSIAFRAHAKELTRYLMYELCKEMPLKKTKAESWIGEIEIEERAEKSPTLVPILRAGLGLVEGAHEIINDCPVSFVGLYRNEETLEAVEYYTNIVPDIAQRSAIILDPMLATGGSLIATIDILKKHKAQKIYCINLVCAPLGIEKVLDKHPDVEIYTSAIDDRLNEHGYILPGLGDAGDRLFGTEK